MLGVALLHQAEKGGSLKANAAPEDSDEGETKAEEKTSVQDIIRRVSAGVAPVLVPMIDQLSGLSEEIVGEVSSRGEDA